MQTLHLWLLGGGGGGSIHQPKFHICDEEAWLVIQNETLSSHEYFTTKAPCDVKR